MKPSVPKGTRDFSPTEMVKRNFIFKTIREVFERYGYQPIETPAMENLETLTGKYGDEGDKLIFKILNSGNYFQDYLDEHPDGLSMINPSLDLSIEGLGKKIAEVTSYISEKALRYDLTVPFARYVVQHQNEITFPFKRYQIQPVWRADKPQKGRYREFYQCDADVIGSDSLLNEVEIVQMIDEVFRKFKIQVTIKINNRKILQGFADYLKVKKEHFQEFITAIDKLDKIGFDSVEKELKEKNVIVDFENFRLYMQGKDLDFNFQQSFAQIQYYKELFHSSNTLSGLKGIEEIEKVFSSINDLGLQNYVNVVFDFTLARGLNYYTGAIFEVKANGVQMGSICGGGRYDDLTGIFGLPNVSGVGISFGIDRIFDVMNELNLFDSIGLTASTTKVMLAHFGEAERNYCIGIASQLRSAGINTEIYPDITKKISKQFDYANKKQIPFVIVIGGDEMKTGELTMKNMNSGEQEKLKIEQIIQKLKS